MENKDTKKNKYKANRKRLIELSKALKALVNEGACETINEALIQTYMEDNPEIEKFKTFNKWKEEGKKIIKGSKAYLLWGKPVKSKQSASDDEEEEYSFFPLSYVFSNTQVESPS
jgi:hypothetical protein